MSTSKLLLALAVSVCLAQTTRAAVDCNSAEADACLARCLPCVTLPVADGTKTADGESCDTCEVCSEFGLCQDCDAGATTLIGQYNAGCAAECLPCTLLPNDGKTTSGASCDTCEVCEEYGLQCVAVECDKATDYYKQCETECLQCIPDGSELTASGASCETCTVCEPLAKCAGSDSAYLQLYATHCNSAEADACLARCLPCVTLPVADGTKTADGESCDTCEVCSEFGLCQDCDAGAATLLGKYNAGCAAECIPCTLLPNDGKTTSGESCDTCEVCEEYGNQCVAVGCDKTTDYYKKCEAECTQCIPPGSKLTASGASCDTCTVCFPLADCVGSDIEVAAKAADVTAVSLKTKVPTAAGIPVVTAGGTIVCASLIIIGASAVAWIV